jgi:hypothetical protein
MGTGTPYQGRILTACGGTGSVDTSVTCSASVWVNPPPVISVDTVTPTPIIPNTATSTGTDTYPSPALHSHRFGVNAAQVGDIPTMQSAGATSVSTGTNTNPASTVAMGHPPIGSINGLQAALDAKWGPVTGQLGQAVFFGSTTPGTNTSTASNTTTSIVAGTLHGQLLGYVLLSGADATNTATASSTSIYYTAPLGTTVVEAYAVGAGAGSGGCTSSGACFTGGGAAGEVQFARSANALYATGQIFYYYVGKGGAAGSSSGGNGAAGGDTWLNTIGLTAKGGLGGPGDAGTLNVYRPGGAGQAGGYGDWYIRGQSGGFAHYSAVVSENYIWGGAGGSTIFGGGGPIGFTTSAANVAPVAGTGFGAGASGVAYPLSNSHAGAAGAPGAIIMRFYN